MARRPDRQLHIHSESPDEDFIVGYLAALIDSYRQIQGEAEPRIQADDGDAVIIDMRSGSRYGRCDLGDNAARIVDFLAELDQQVAGQLGTAPAE